MQRWRHACIERDWSNTEWRGTRVVVDGDIVDSNGEYGAPSEARIAIDRLARDGFELVAVEAYELRAIYWLKQPAD